MGLIKHRLVPELPFGQAKRQPEYNMVSKSIIRGVPVREEKIMLKSIPIVRSVEDEEDNLAEIEEDLYDEPEEEPYEEEHALISAPIPNFDEETQEQAKQEAYQLGYQAGESDGIRKGANQAEDTIREKVNEVLQTIDQAVMEKNRILESSEDAVLQLAKKVAEQIVQAEVRTNPQALLNIVQEAMTKMTSADQVIIRTNPADVTALNENIDYFKAKMPNVQSIMIQEDQAVIQGGVMLETKMGYIDATLGMKLDMLETAWKNN